MILDFGDTAAADEQITAGMLRTGGYHVLTHAGQFTVWVSRPSAGPNGEPDGEHRVGH